MKNIFLSTIVFLFCLSLPKAQEFRFSGYLGAPDGVSVQGFQIVSMQLSLHDQLSGGSTGYIQTYPSVQVSDGYFQISVGPGLPNMESFEWVELKVNGEVLTPRTRLMTLPLSFNSDRLQGMSAQQIKDDVISAIGTGSGGLTSAPPEVIALQLTTANHGTRLDTVEQNLQVISQTVNHTPDHRSGCGPWQCP